MQPVKADKIEILSQCGYDDIVKHSKSTLATYYRVRNQYKTVSANSPR